MKRKRETEILLCTDAWLKIFLTLDSRDDITSLACVSKSLYEISKTDLVRRRLLRYSRNIVTRNGCVVTLEKVEYPVYRIIDFQTTKECAQLCLISWDEDKFWDTDHRGGDGVSLEIFYKSKTTLIVITPYRVITNNFRKFKSLADEGAFIFGTISPYD